GQAFTALSQAGHSVAMISQASSESSICLVLPESESAHAVAALERAFELERKLHLIDRIAAQKRVALIAVVGLGMRGHAGIAARTFSAISGAGVNIDEKGFSPAALQRFAKQKAAGTRLFDGGVPQRYDALWPLPSYRPILVDLTSDETGELLAEAMQHGFNIVLANKKPLAGPQ